MSDWKRIRDRLRWLAVTGILLTVPAAASPPSVSLGALGPDDLRTWEQPLWMEMPGEPSMELTAHETIEGGADMAATQKVGPEPPKPVLKPYAPGDPVSVGLPNRGYLVDGVPLSGNEQTIVRPGRNYGTLETVNAINTAIDAVFAKYPEGTHKLMVADLSLKQGGRFPPHKSHQSGRDADIGYWFTDRAPDRLMKVWPSNIDAGRTWTFLESMLKDDKVQFLFIDWRLQKVLYEHALEVEKVPKAKLDRWFSYPTARVKRGAPIRHLKGHADHMHVRFHSPQAVANFDGYVKHWGPEVLKPVPVHYRVRRGDSLARIAKKFRLKIKDLKRWNRMRKSRIKPRQRLVVGFRRPDLPRSR